MYSQENTSHFAQMQSISRVFGTCNYPGQVELAAEWKTVRTPYKTGLIAQIYK